MPTLQYNNDLEEAGSHTLVEPVAHIAVAHTMHDSPMHITEN